MVHRQTLFVKCTLYSVHGQGYIIDCTIWTTYSGQFVHFTIQCTLYTVKGLNLFVKCGLCIHGQYINCTVYNLYNVHCTHCITYMRLVFIKTLLYVITLPYIKTLSYVIRYKGCKSVSSIGGMISIFWWFFWYGGMILRFLLRENFWILACPNSCFSTHFLPIFLWWPFFFAISYQNCLNP